MPGYRAKGSRHTPLVQTILNRLLLFLCEPLTARVVDTQLWCFTTNNTAVRSPLPFLIARLVRVEGEHAPLRIRRRQRAAQRACWGDEGEGGGDGEAELHARTPSHTASESRSVQSVTRKAREVMNPRA